MINLFSIHTGNFHLDGGAMFGVVPKTIWEKQVAANEKNLCNWAMRCLLVENTSNNRRILIDTGIGSKQSEKFFGYYDLNGDYSLINSIQIAGFRPEDITDVLLTHLHFDHAGGAVNRVDDQLIPAFPNAKYWVNEQHWNHAHNSNPREKASFLNENFDALLEHGVLHFINEDEVLADCIEINVFNGHTIGMIVPIVNNGSYKIAFAADLIPSAAHIPVNYVMGYDIQPLITMKEKSQFLNQVVEENILLFYEHDFYTELSTVVRNDKGLFVKGIEMNINMLKGL